MNERLEMRNCLGDSMIRRGLTIGVIVLLLSVLVLAVIGMIAVTWHYSAGRAAKSDQADQSVSQADHSDGIATNGKSGSKMPPKPVRVQVVNPQKGGPERTLTRPGTIHAFQHADLFAKEQGYLHHQTVDIGDMVKKGQALAEIYAPELAANVDKAAADLKKANAQVEVMESRKESAAAELAESEVKVEQAQADLDTAIAMVDLRQKQYERFKELVESKSIQRELLDEKFEALKAAEASQRSSRMAVISSKAAVISSKAHLRGAAADLDDAKAFVNVCEATLEREKVFLSYTSIRAPFDGVITHRTYHEGDFILDTSGNGNKPLLSISATSLMRVIVDVPAPSVPYTRPGVPADVNVDTLGGKVFKGKVDRMSYIEDYTSLTMRTEVDLQNPDNELVNGMFCSVTLHLGRDSRSLRIPSSCLMGKEHDGKRQVYVVMDQKAHKTDVTVGIEDGITTEILSGLDPHDQVINGHGAALENGVPVQVDSEQHNAGQPKDETSASHGAN